MNAEMAALMDYTDWERQQWHEFLQQHFQALRTRLGPNAGNRFQTVGDVIRHIFSAETRYIERLSDKPLTDATSIPADDLEILFAFGRKGRKAFRGFVEALAPQDCDAMKDFGPFFGGFLKATPRKIAMHVLVHETRHWAQIATLFRLNGMHVDLHDFLLSPVLGGEFKRAQVGASR